MILLQNAVIVTSEKAAEGSVLIDGDRIAGAFHIIHPGLHPDNYGYTLWAQSIEKKVVKILKKYGIR